MHKVFDFKKKTLTAMLYLTEPYNVNLQKKKKRQQAGNLHSLQMYIEKKKQGNKRIFY